MNKAVKSGKLFIHHILLKLIDNPNYEKIGSPSVL
jgi:hypothetical protein